MIDSILFQVYDVLLAAKFFIFLRTYGRITDRSNHNLLVVLDIGAN